MVTAKDQPLSADKTMPSRMSRTLAALYDRVPGLKKIAKSNAGVLVGATASRAVIRFSSNLVLTRILTPADFGVMFVINAVLTSFQLLSETGAWQFLIRDEKGDQPEVVNTVRSILIFRGFIIAAIVAVLAPQLTALFGKPELTGPMRLMAVIPAIEGCLNLRFHLITRERRQRINDTFELGVFFGSIIVTFVLALVLKSYWAFIYAAIASAVFKVVGAEIFYKRIPFKLMFDMNVIRRLWTFSSFLFFSSLLSIAINQTDKIIVGNRLPLDVAGVYAMAMTLTVIFINLGKNFSRRVFYADAAASWREKGNVPEAYYGHMQRMRCVLLFVFGGGITFGEMFFQVFFDDRYLLAGTIFSISVIRPVIQMYTDPAQAFNDATGFTKAGFIGSILRLIHILTMAPLLFSMFGLMGLVWAVTTMNIWACLFMNFRLMRLGVWSLKFESVSLLALAAGALTGLLGTVILGYFANLWGL